MTSKTSDDDLTDLGYFIKGLEGEKFVTSHIIIGGVLITASYVPPEASDPVCEQTGTSFAFVFALDFGTGQHTDPDADSEARRLYAAIGVPSDPRVTISSTGRRAALPEGVLGADALDRCSGRNQRPGRARLLAAALLKGDALGKIATFAAIGAIALGLLLVSPTGASAQQHQDGPRPVSGQVTEVDPVSRTVELGGETYFVPADVFDVSRLAPGAHVILHWKLRGNRMVATQIEASASEG